MSYALLGAESSSDSKKETKTLLVLGSVVAIGSIGGAIYFLAKHRWVAAAVTYFIPPRLLVLALPVIAPEVYQKALAEKGK